MPRYDGLPFRGNVRPPGPWRINRESPQAHGLVLWAPDGRTDLVGHQRVAARSPWVDASRVLPMLGEVLDYADSGGSYFALPVSAWPITVSAWIWRDNGANDDVVFGLFEASPLGAADGHYTQASSSVWKTCAAQDGSFDLPTGTVAAATGAWQCVTMVVASDTSRLCYVDGTLSSTGTASRAWRGYTRLALGYYEADTQGVFGTADGGISDVRVYRRALSADEIWQLFDASTRWDLYAPA